MVESQIQETSAFVIFGGIKLSRKKEYQYNLKQFDMLFVH